MCEVNLLRFFLIFSSHSFYGTNKLNGKEEHKYFMNFSHLNQLIDMRQIILLRCHSDFKIWYGSMVVTLFQNNDVILMKTRLLVLVTSFSKLNQNISFTRSLEFLIHVGPISLNNFPLMNEDEVRRITRRIPNCVKIF